MVGVSHLPTPLLATVVTVELGTLNFVNCHNIGFNSVRGNFKIMLVAFLLSESTKKIRKKEQKKREIRL